MLKEASYKEKLILLQDWLPEILADIKKDLKNDHLMRDLSFCKTYLSGRNPQKASHEELVQAYKRALIESQDAEEIAAFISNRWILKHTDMYQFFAHQLESVNPDFSTIDELDLQFSKELVDQAVAQFGPQLTYLFSTINAVVFPEEIYRQLSKHATENQQKKAHEQQQLEEQVSLEHLKRTHEQQMARLVDKYEKKLIGLQKKYLTDTENLKKHVALLQQKLARSP